jgi:iron complex outermembrane receptor protein
MAQRHELELQNTVQTGAENRFVWGAALRYDTANAPFLFLASQNLRESRLFAHDEWRILPPLLMNIGAMLEDDGMGNKRTSPRLSLNYHISPQDTLRAGVSVAYRNPVFGEENSNKRFILGSNLYQSWLSSGGLRPERALSREIGYMGELYTGLSIDVRAYNDQVSNIIWVDAISVNMPGLVSQNSTVWDFRNEFSTHYTGFEGTVKGDWDVGSLTFNFAHQLASAVLTTPSTFLPAYARDFNKTTPQNSGSLLFVTKMNEGISLSAGYYYQGAVKVLDGVYPQPIMRRLDMRLAKQFGSMSDKKIGGMEVALVVQNALQEHIVGYSGYIFGRRAYVAATTFF